MEESKLIEMMESTALQNQLNQPLPKIRCDYQNRHIQHYQPELEFAVKTITIKYNRYKYR